MATLDDLQIGAVYAFRGDRYRLDAASPESGAVYALVNVARESTGPVWWIDAAGRITAYVPDDHQWGTVVDLARRP